MKPIVQSGRQRSHTFPIKNGLQQERVSSPFLFNFGLEHATRRVEVNQDGLKLNGNQLLVYADDFNILGGSVHTIQKNTDVLVFGSKETGIQVIADKTKYMVMSRDQNAGRSRSIKNDNSSFEMMETVQIFGNNPNIRIVFRKNLRAD